MSFLHLFILALVQGVTEFLPISSSAHLVLVPVVMGEADQGALMDVAAHVGTLLAVLVYFWRDLWEVCTGLRLRLKTGETNPAARLAMQLVIATIPVVIVGYALHEYNVDMMRSLPLIAATTLIFAVLLGLADRFGGVSQKLDSLKHKQALLIGLSQVFALIPGTSRSGVTMTAARAMGYDRISAARFSMLLGIPTIAGAGLLAIIDLCRMGDAMLTLEAFLMVGLSFIAALGSIAVLMRWLQHAGFMPFVVYRLILGAGLLVYLYV